MKLLAIDPGPVESALLLYDMDMRIPERWEKRRNRPWPTWAWRADRLAVEMVASYGMAVGQETFDTCLAAGQFCERWWSYLGDEAALVYRREVKLHLCGDSRAKDANIRQALIDRYGPGKEKAIGRKASPGPLYGMKRDCWSALGVAVTAAETRLAA